MSAEWLHQVSILPLNLIYLRPDHAQTSNFDCGGGLMWWTFENRGVRWATINTFEVHAIGCHHSALRMGPETNPRMRILYLF